MKTTAFLLTLLLFSVTTLLAQETEEDAIRQVIEGETNAWLERDYNQWAKHWGHTPYAYFSVTMNEYIEFADGWDEISSHMERTMEETPPVNSEMNVDRSDWHYKITDNLAWARFNQSTNNGVMLKEQRVLEKMDGQWKIINMTTVNPSSYPVEARNPEP
ncbi:MAG: hypothetical protein WBA23_16665 [Tunicatimonas sp.]|uniref:hypothetical protein n=1 Tax=Tunicatimonas sp. TaxID=1940096 RepID=UPI003C75F243